MAEDPPNVETDDLEIALLMMERKEEGLERLFRKYASRVRGGLFNKYGGTLQEEEIDEAVNQAALNLWNHIDTYDEKRAPLGAYLYKIAVRYAIDILRREQKQGSRYVPFDPFEKWPIAPTPRKTPPSAKSEAQCKTLIEIIDSLPAKQEHIMRADLAAGGSADSERLAQELQSPIGSIYAMRSMARKKIHDELIKHGLA